MVPLGFFKKRSFNASAIVISLVGFSLFGIIFFLTLYFQNVRGYSAQGAGALTLPLTCMTMVVAPLAGKLNPRVGPRVLMTAGMLLTSGALFTLSQISVHTSYAMVIAPAYVAMGIGIAMTMPTTTSTAMGSVSPDKAGIASGVVNASRQVGGALGIAVIGAILASYTHLAPGSPGSAQQFVDGLHAALLFSAGITFAGAIVAIVLVRESAAVEKAHIEAIAA
jgi:MFS family permease